MLGREEQATGKEEDPLGRVVLDVVMHVNSLPFPAMSIGFYEQLLHKIKTALFPSPLLTRSPLHPFVCPAERALTAARRAIPRLSSSTVRSYSPEGPKRRPWCCY